MASPWRGLLPLAAAVLLLLCSDLPEVQAFAPGAAHRGCLRHTRMLRQGVVRDSRSGARSRGGICMMAKKKKGPAGGVSLEELEAQEALLFGDELPPPPPPDAPAKKKKDKKDKKAQPVANEMAALAMAMADGVEVDFDAGAAAEPQAPPAQKGAAAGGIKSAKAAALASLESLYDDDAGGGDDDDALLGGGKAAKKDKKKDKKGGKGAAPNAAMELVAASEALAAGEDVVCGAEQQKDSDEARDSDEEEELEEDPNRETLEEKIRKTRPPPRVRITESAQPGFVSMRLDGVAVTFRNQEVLTDASWEVKTGDRVGLVGPNGGGKTTQMKILAGELEPTTGEVIMSAKSLRVAFLRQEFVDELVPERSLKDEMLSVFADELGVLAALAQVEVDMGTKAVQADPERMEEAINRLTSLQEDAERLKVYDLDTRVEKVMDLMGFIPGDGRAPVSSFSGGWRMRIGLGKILLRDPNILLLDEPTNHLDLESVEWLENFLQNQNLPMVIVSHDREFLDRVCTRIVDTEGGVATTYDGNYSRFLRLKKSRLEALESAYAAQQKKIGEERAWINKFKNKGSFGSQIKSREKAIERMLTGSDAIKKPPRPGKPFVFRFPPAPRASEEVLSMEGVTHGYGPKPLFEHANLLVERGQRIAFLGPNGVGKSTLLRLAMGLEQPAGGGSARFGPSVLANYFQQNQADALDLDKTVLEVVEDASSGQSYNELRKLLGQFLFKGDAVQKKIRQLSGGEKARVALCTFMLRPANLLVLDEPTNHLDIPAKEMLEEALQHFDGAVLVVSHDRYFVSQVANTICVLEEGQLKRYEGDYRYYMEQNEQLLGKVESRYVEGVNGIQSAKVVDLTEITKDKRNFGGKGGPSGDKTKGVKNAKRMK